MKDASGPIRQWLYNVLNLTVVYNGSYLSCYSFAGKDQAMPYILLGEIYMIGEELSTKDCWITEHEATIEIYTSFTGNDASYVQLDAIVDDVLAIIRRRIQALTGSGGQSVAGITGFNTIVTNVISTASERFVHETQNVVMKSIILKLILEEQ